MLDQPRRAVDGSWITSAVRKRFSVALSFDDGYLDHYQIAELLYRRGVRATFFLITGMKYWNNKPLLTHQPQLIRNMRKMKHEIASHTHSHPNLQCITREQVGHELRSSKQYLENLLNEPVGGFAYPYGKYDMRICRTASDYYGYARTAGEPQNPNLYEVPIRSPGSSLRACSLEMTKDMLRSGGFAIVLLHATNTRSVRVWIEYMKLFRVHFTTVSEIVDAYFVRRNAITKSG
jgi:peptidoglycan/xylan/chitin deacetylase (PgdA/CDA1 family)